MPTPCGWSYRSVISLALGGFVPLPACATALMTVQTHQLTDEDGATLLSGDQVMVTIVAANAGDTTATATLSDFLTNLAQPSAVTVNGFPCATCSLTNNSLTVQMLVPDGTSDLVQFTASVPSSSSGPEAANSVSIAFSPADPGTSPTSADIATLSLDSVFRSPFE